ncbi:hypothetical protein [uncultured Phenylobacterium sp.]|nr:hypothetical protein [uncultured Phenylobacterium sp.]
MIEYVRHAMEIAYLRQVIDLAVAHPVGAVATLVVTCLYFNLMFSGPRAY